MPLPPAPKLLLADSDREQLTVTGGQGGKPRGMTLRASIVLCAAEGLPNHEIARTLCTSVPTVLLWRKRYESGGLAAILDRPRSGRRKRISSQKEADIVDATVWAKPRGAAFWTLRALAAAKNVSPATVSRIWEKHNLRPESAMLTNDCTFAPSQRYIVGLYMTNRDKVMVLSFRYQIAALARDEARDLWKRYHGRPSRSTPLFDALHNLEGKVRGARRYPEFLRFLERIDQTVEADHEIHLILGNGGIQKHLEVKKWLASRPRYTLHFTPNGSSWSDQVEHWFAGLGPKPIFRTAFPRVGKLIRSIDRYNRSVDKEQQFFQWIDGG